MFYKNIKIFFYVIVTSLFLISVYVLYEARMNNSKIENHIRIFKNQEKILENESVTQEQLDALQKCENKISKARCLAKFYEDYNSEYGLEKSFSNLAFLIKNYPKYSDYCHMIAHGIGHSQLNKDKDFDLALSRFFVGNLYKNMATCGTGYIHGLLEQTLSETENEEQIVSLFKDVCNNAEVKLKIGRTCIHGLGHAAMIQLKYDIDRSVRVCKEIATDEFDLFECYTGIFMEQVLSFTAESIIQKKDGGDYIFLLCDKYKEDLVNKACVFESGIALQNFVEVDENGNRFSSAIRLCKVIDDMYLRYVCVKNIAIRAITDDGEFNVKKMCLKNTSTPKERIYCAYVYGHRLGQAIAGFRNEKYFEITRDVCGVLNYFERSQCFQLVTSNIDRSYFLRPDDLDVLETPYFISIF